MSNFSIGLSGLQVAQRAIEMVGTNISNASTDGYHRQDLSISPVSLGGTGLLSLGGAEITSVQRSMDTLVEQEMLRQQTAQGQSSQQLSSLQSVESALGDIDNSNLGMSLNDFYNSLNELTSQADSDPLRQQVVSSADTLAGQFRTLSQFVDDMQNHITQSAQSQIDQVNSLSTQIAKLNGDIANATIHGASANVLKDQRDQAITELSNIADVTVEGSNDPSGQVNVIAWGIPLVMNTTSTPLESSLMDDQNLGISVQGADFYQGHFRGGTLGGLLALKNDLLPQITDQLNTLASQIMQGVNRQHVQGVGEDGPFTELTGEKQSDGKIATWNQGVTTGDFYVRVTNTATGEVTRQEVSVNPATDTMAMVTAKINAIPGLSANIVDGALHMQADDGYKFDFLPALSSQPQTSTITGTSAATIDGQYTGTTNQVYKFTVVGSGDVGVSDNLHLQVHNQAGDLVTTLNIGQGYVAGDALDAADGIQVHLGSGSVNDGDEFTTQALASSDTSGFLAAAGMNTFFAGSSAADMHVRDEILNDPSQLACSLTPEGMDNGNITAMASLADTSVSALGNMTPSDYFRQLVTGVGQSVSTNKSRLDSINAITQQLKLQQDAIGGVDINQEAAKLMVFERMFQGMAKFLDGENQTIKSLMETIT